eukprot:TRINITY_DN25900_c0_g1_i1.p1 TRINITY_DN25900_c0_g1~~TRINITY_DN25900_c0_g1_i1.p1  ORF type:complete len:1368 (+),score=256.78 TRINITY_DN25900_c0_g1_i1:56-4105(+)
MEGDERGVGERDLTSPDAMLEVSGRVSDVSTDEGEGAEPPGSAPRVVMSARAVTWLLTLSFVAVAVTLSTVLTDASGRRGVDRMKSASNSNVQTCLSGCTDVLRQRTDDLLQTVGVGMSNSLDRQIQSIADGAATVATYLQGRPHPQTLDWSFHQEHAGMLWSLLTSFGAPYVSACGMGNRAGQLVSMSTLVHANLNDVFLTSNDNMSVLTVQNDGTARNGTVLGAAEPLTGHLTSAPCTRADPVPGVPDPPVTSDVGTCNFPFLDPLAQPTFQLGMAFGEPRKVFVTPPLSISLYLTILFESSWTDPAGDKIGVVTFGWDVRDVSRLLRSILFSSLPNATGARAFVTVNDTFLRGLVPNFDYRGIMLAWTHGNASETVVRPDPNRGPGIVVESLQLLPAERSTDVIISEAARAINGSYQAFQGSSQAVLNGTTYYISSFSFTHSTGVDWWVVVCVDQEYILGEVIRNGARITAAIESVSDDVDQRLNEDRYILFGAVTGIALFLGLISACLIRLGVRPLKRLNMGMAEVALLNFDDLAADLSESTADADDAPLFAVSEFVQMKASFKQMVTLLRAFRTYVPSAVLSSMNIALDGAPEEVTREDTGPGTPMSAGKASLGGPGFTAVASDARAALTDNSNDTKRVGTMQGRRRVLAHLQNLGAMKARTATVLQVEAHFGNTTLGVVSKSVPDFVAGVLASATTTNGVPLQICAQEVLIGWNTHSPRLDHALNACQCALALRHALRTVLVRCPADSWWGAGAATGAVLVGHAGINSLRASVAQGPPLHLAGGLAKLTHGIGCQLLLSDPVFDRVKNQVIARIVDAVSACPEPWGTCPDSKLVYELIGMVPRGSEPYDVGGTLYLEGFSALRRLRLPVALQKLSEHLTSGAVDRADDFHAMRLLRVAATLLTEHGAVTAGDASPRPAYCRQLRAWDMPEDRAPDSPPGEISEEVWGRWFQMQQSAMGPGGTEPFGQAEESGVSEAAALRLHIEEKFLKTGVSTSNNGSLALPSGCQLSPLGASPVGTFPSGERRWSAGSSDSTASGPGFGIRGGARKPLPSSGSSEASVSKDLPQFLETIDRRRWQRSDRLLGTGSFGEVWMGMSDTGDFVAIKALPLPREATETVMNVIREVALMSRIRHDNVVSYVSSGLEGNSIIIVMEYVPGGSLDSVLGQFTTMQVSVVQRYMRDVLRGLHYLHCLSPPVVHRDLKPGNILVNIQGECKLVDFGSAGELLLAAAADGTRRIVGGMVGTAAYIAPEATRNLGGTESDIWSFGIMFIQLLTGSLPYDLQNFVPFQFMRRLGADDSFGPTIPDGFSIEATNFMRRCLMRDPAKRPAAGDLIDDVFFMSRQ